MLEWLSTLGNFFSTIANFFTNFLKGAIDAITLITKGFGYAILIISYMPSQYRTPLLIILSVSVIITIVHLGE